MPSEFTAGAESFRSTNFLHSPQTTRMYSASNKQDVQQVESSSKKRRSLFREHSSHCRRMPCSACLALEFLQASQERQCPKATHCVYKTSLFRDLLQKASAGKSFWHSKHGHKTPTCLRISFSSLFGSSLHLGPGSTAELSSLSVSIYKEAL